MQIKTSGVYYREIKLTLMVLMGSVGRGILFLNFKKMYFITLKLI